MPTTCFDVANYFFSRLDEDAGDVLSNLKLQKLVYYAQGFALALLERPLFSEPLVAWQMGPVCPPLFRTYAIDGPGGFPRRRGSTSACSPRWRSSSSMRSGRSTASSPPGSSATGSDRSALEGDRRQRRDHPRAAQSLLPHAAPLLSTAQKTIGPGVNRPGRWFNQIQSPITCGCGPRRSPPLQRSSP